MTNPISRNTLISAVVDQRRRTNTYPTFLGWDKPAGMDHLVKDRVGRHVFSGVRRTANHDGVAAFSTTEKT
ncbi:hypothetical protein LCGC14_0916500 [marine sediment metagenome]|uniref:Uncharacterized protein n=1 Tax=marine sediment metagenome TaxID=412755 RepID=A0A0F9NS61_9ZZZZ